MKILLLLLVFFFELNAFAEANCSHGSNSLKCVTYVKNYDADTVTFNIPNVHPLIGNKVNVRVLGVDTPEIRTKNKCEKKKALEAKMIVSKKLKSAKRIDLVDIKRGKYFRIVADVIIDGESLSRFLIDNGLAYKYYGKTKKKMNWCLPARDIASLNK